jgi:predicted Zn-dependent protease
VVFLGKSAYAIGIQASNAAVFREYEAAMTAATASFHPITAEERALAKPLQLRVITARAGLTFSELARTSPLGRFAENHLRVLNGLYPSGEPVAGQALKIVE